MTSAYWLRKAQSNTYAFMWVFILTKGWEYDYHYRTGLDEQGRVLQKWTYDQVGKSFARLPTKAIHGWYTAEEYATGNIYLMVDDQLKRSYYEDSRGQRIHFCNPYRVYILASTGPTGLKNMAGRSAFDCASQETVNPYEPWGPGRAGGASDWAMEIVGGKPVPPETPTGPLWDIPINPINGATLHEAFHCIGVQHPSEVEYGPEAWLSPMAGWWFFGTPECHLLPHEIEYLKGSHFFK